MDDQVKMTEQIKYSPSGRLFGIGGIFLLGFAVSWMVFSIKNANDVTEAFNSGFNTAVERFNQSPIAATIPKPDEDAKAISGLITDIQGREVTIQTTSLNPFADPALEYRVVLVGPDTKITQRVQKDSIIIQKESEDFYQLILSGKAEGSTPPDSTVTKEVSLKELSIGTAVIVVSDKSIANEKEFWVTEINF